MKQTLSLKLALAIAACACTFAWAQIPEVRITTQNNQVPTYSNDPGCSSGGWGLPGMGMNKLPYMLMTEFKLTGPNQSQTPYSLTRTGQPDSVRRRGNSTATASKIPFRVKFDKKTSLFGKEPAKSWVFLANYYDHTFALNAVSFELGKRLGVPFTPTFQFVDLYLNGEYRGIYQMTEQVQAGAGRVDIDKGFGWLAELDYHSPKSDKCLAYFTTPQNRYNLTMTVRSPDPDDIIDSTEYRFVKMDINRLVDSMASNRFPENGYRDQIDLESWAKYVLIQQLMDNFDFNSKIQSGGLPGSNFMHKDLNKRIFAGPLWDFDLAAGVSPTQNFPTHYLITNEPIRPKHAFYQRLWEDPAFLAKFKKAWDKHQSDFNAMPTLMDSIANLLASRAQANFSSISYTNSGWGGGMGGDVRPTNEQTYRGEITKLKNWWTARMQNFTQQINQMNIDTSKDIDQNTSVATRTWGAACKNISPVRNGINLRVDDKATLRIFRLDGREIKKVRLARGDHSVRFGDLPKGMYLVNVSIDGDKRVLRTMVR